MLSAVYNLKTCQTSVFEPNEINLALLWFILGVILCNCKTMQEWKLIWCWARKWITKVKIVLLTILRLNCDENNFNIYKSLLPVLQTFDCWVRDVPKVQITWLFFSELESGRDELFLKEFWLSSNTLAISHLSVLMFSKRY